MIFKKKKVKKDDLLDNILSAQSALDEAYSDFETATEPELSDSSIYEMNSIINKYNYILKNREPDNGLTKDVDTAIIKNDIEK